MNKLHQKYNKYLKLITKVQDDYGFIHSDECDSLLWTSLIGCLPSIKPNIYKCKDKKGVWYRRPQQDCFPNHSKSSISRDMLLGLLWYCYFNDKQDIVNQIVVYALKHFGVMGEGKGIVGKSRINIMPPLFVTYLLMSKWGKYFKWLDLIIPASYNTKQDDYRAHLQVMHCLIRNKITKKNNYKKIFKYHAKRQPNNALFQYANGNKNGALKILNDPILFPHNRLPRKSDRSTHWLWQRDYGKDWYADTNSDKVHTGGDFLFLYYLINLDT